MLINSFASGYNAAGFFFDGVRKGRLLRTHFYLVKTSLPSVCKGIKIYLRMFANFIDLYKHS